MAGRFYIARTAWLYNNGGNNFIAKIVAAADKQGALRVVADEFGNPTYAPDLADAIARLIDCGTTASTTSPTVAIARATSGR